MSNFISKEFVKGCFKPRPIDANKGTNGHQLNICGSYLMPGAAVICAEAALKSGVGLLKAVFPKSIYSVMTSHLVEPLFAPMGENEKGTFSSNSIDDILSKLPWANSIALGCGLGVNEDTKSLVSEVIKNSEVPIVLDADGINSIIGNIDLLKDSKAPIVLTPHPGEMSRLIGKNVDFVQANREGCAKEFASEYNCILVLKGVNTVVTNGKDIYINPTGNPGMAMGGTGDMLTGMLASFIAQDINPFDAAKCAVYIHGLCGDACRDKISERGMTVPDMLDELGVLMSEFE